MIDDDKKNKNKQKIAIVTCIALAVTAGGGWLYYNSTSKHKDNWDGGVNYRPPTKQEQSAGDEKKKEIVEEQEQQDQIPQQNSDDTPTDAANKKPVSVAISDAEQYGNSVEIRSFVPSYSRDGTCTLTFTQQTHTFTRTTPAYKDVSSTICPTVKVNTGDFPNGGQWQVVVSFESTNAKGQSNPRTFTVKK